MKDQFEEFVAERGRQYPSIILLLFTPRTAFVPFLGHDVEIRLVICMTKGIEPINASYWRWQRTLGDQIKSRTRRVRGHFRRPVRENNPLMKPARTYTDCRTYPRSIREGRRNANIAASDWPIGRCFRQTVGMIERWWHGRNREELFDLSADARLMDRAQVMLRSDGWIPAEATYFPAGATLLREYLSEIATPDVDELVGRVQEFAERPRPSLPFPSMGMSIVAGAAARTVESDALWVDPARVFPGRDGFEAFFRDQGDWSRNLSVTENTVRNEPVLGLAEFARRIAVERGNVKGLADLLGPSYGTDMPMLDLHGWDTPLGAVFQVNANGNHRLAALAALSVPCVLAEVTWCRGPFDTSTGKTTSTDKLRSDYRMLLHAFGVASYPDPLNFMRNDTGIITEWPILIDTAADACASLQAMERLAGRREQQIGRLPRHLFDDPEALQQLGRDVQQQLTDLIGETPGVQGRKRRWWQ